VIIVRAPAAPRAATCRDTRPAARVLSLTIDAARPVACPDGAVEEPLTRCIAFAIAAHPRLMRC
jgi:hypothetical protein